MRSSTPPKCSLLNLEWITQVQTQNSTAVLYTCLLKMTLRGSIKFDRLRLLPNRNHGLSERLCCQHIEEL